MKWYVEALQKYADFSGRSRRREWWTFTLVNLLILVAVVVVDDTLDLGFLNALYVFAVFLPAIAVSVRRLHDTGRSGWWILIAGVPIVGAIALLLVMAMDSESGDNEFGPNPKEGELPARVATG